jgi:creatinine amidohydrolase
MNTHLTHNTMIDMNWTEVRARVEQHALVLLPIGVIEEHGPHLSLGTDIYTAHLQCCSIQEKLEQAGRKVVIAPPFYWGVCQCTGGFLGSFQIRKETAVALLFDILASLAGFGFRDVFGVNAHGDIEQNLACMEAFKTAREQLGINARFAFPRERLQPFGLSGDEDFLCPVAAQANAVNTAAVLDVHAGNIETATMHTFYPELVDVGKAKSLPAVALPDERVMDWLWGGHIHSLSSEGYLGSPADFETTDAVKNLDDVACRVSEAIADSLSLRGEAG